MSCHHSVCLTILIQPWCSQADRCSDMFTQTADDDPSCTSIGFLFFSASTVIFQWRQPSLHGWEMLTGYSLWRRGERRVTGYFSGVLWCEQSAPTWRAWADKPWPLHTHSGISTVCWTRRFWVGIAEKRRQPEFISAQVAIGDGAWLLHPRRSSRRLLLILLFLSENRTMSAGATPLTLLCFCNYVWWRQVLRQRACLCLVLCPLFLSRVSALWSVLTVVDNIFVDHQVHDYSVESINITPPLRFRGNL